MTFNNTVQLSGFLGQEPRAINKETKKFSVLQVATNDNYPVKTAGETKWEEKTVWHDVLVFRPSVVKFANDLKKGDRVAISGSISYKLFKDQQGYNRKQATIIANTITKLGSPGQDKLIQTEIDEIVEKLTA